MKEAKKRITVSITTTVANFNEIKELLNKAATLPTDEINIQINYLPSPDLSIE